MKWVKNETNNKIKTIRSDYGEEFKNNIFDHLCISKFFLHEFSPRSKNTIAKWGGRKKESHIVRAIQFFWVETVNTACYVNNRIHIHLILN